ncbi:MAG: F0F1 ATP synthase subunit beta, partial [Treponema sp.]|nr:F0F1 ATP synthase subunit beta [Treponema sp.]
MAGTGIITQIVGPVVDVRFEEGQIPPLLSALEIKRDVPASGTAAQAPVILEVLQHIGDNRVRCVAMEATEGLRRGLAAEDTGGPIRVPVGEAVLGRMFSVTGKIIDDRGAFT